VCKSYLIICLLLASCVSKPAQDSSQHRDFTKAMLPVAKTNNYSDEAIRLKIKKHVQTYADRGEFSGSVLVAKGDAILFKGAFGFADIKKKIKNEIDTRYLIGSTTKSFTAIALMRFEEKGLVNLNSPISKYLPNLRKGLADKLTLDILLRMTSGLPNHIKRLASIKKKDITTDGIVKIINTAKLEYDPDTKYSYSNLNYNLIAAVMEKVSGLSYDQILKKEIFDPLNMKNSGTNDFHTLRKRRASGYFVPVMEKVANYNLSYASGSGNIYSTIEDIYKWDQALYDDDFLSKKQLKTASLPLHNRPLQNRSRTNRSSRLSIWSQPRMQILAGLSAEAAWVYPKPVLPNDCKCSQTDGKEAKRQKMRLSSSCREQVYLR